MQRCPEIESLTARWLRAIESCDSDLLGDLYSQQSGGRVIGTDPREWWSGYSEFMPIWRAQLAEATASGGVIVDWSDVEGFENGTTGWVAARGVFRFLDRSDFPFRMTGVLELERGHWRFVQTHVSGGVHNEESVGLSFTTALDEVNESLRIEQPNLGAVAAPDGTVSILFTDLEGSTSLAERLGDERWVDLLHWHHRVVIESATSGRGFVVKSLGDGYMLAFASASDAVKCARQIVDALGVGWQDHRLAVRAGIHTGDAVRDKNDFYGHTVTVAARVAALANGGEVLVTRVVRDLTRGRGFRWGPGRSVDLKGFSEPYEVMPLVVDTTSRTPETV